MERRIHYLLIALLGILSCQQPKDNDNQAAETTNASKQAPAPLAVNYLQQYDFAQPTAIIKLPKEMKEVSGIRFINDSVLVMISDSKPDVFFYNVRQQAIVRQIRVASKGDFEDIAVVGDHIFVLQSNGILWTISQYNESPAITSDSLSLQKPFELEGLSPNEAGDSLYLAAKYWNRDDPAAKGMLPVWALSIADKKLSAKPVLLVPATVNIGNDQEEFRTSGILPVYPVKRWLLISTNNKFIVQVDPAGTIDTIQKLDKDIFIKPEGIAFAPGGTLYISNEGTYDKATILSFKKKN